MQIDSFREKSLMTREQKRVILARELAEKSRVSCYITSLIKRENISYGEWIISKQNNKWLHAVGNRKK